MKHVARFSCRKVKLNAAASFTVPPGNRRDVLWKAGARDRAARDRAGRTKTRMSIADQIYEQVKALPDPLAREVLDFIAFRRDRGEWRDLMSAQAASLAPVWDNA